MLESSEANLYSAVIYQALLDYNHMLTGRCKEHYVSNYEPNLRDGEEAKRFLTDVHGAFARSRRDLCHAARICPDGVRDRVLKAIERDGNLSSLIRSANAPRAFEAA